MTSRSVTDSCSAGDLFGNHDPGCEEQCPVEEIDCEYQQLIFFRGSVRVVSWVDNPNGNKAPGTLLIQINKDVTATYHCDKKTNFFPIIKHRQCIRRQRQGQGSEHKLETAKRGFEHFCLVVSVVERIKLFGEDVLRFGKWGLSFYRCRHAIKFSDEKLSVNIRKSIV